MSSIIVIVGALVGGIILGVIGGMLFSYFKLNKQSRKANKKREELLLESEQWQNKVKEVQDVREQFIKQFQPEPKRRSVQTQTETSEVRGQGRPEQRSRVSVSDPSSLIRD